MGLKKQKQSTLLEEIKTILAKEENGDEAFTATDKVNALKDLFNDKENVEKVENDTDIKPLHEITFNPTQRDTDKVEKLLSLISDVTENDSENDSEND